MRYSDSELRFLLFAALFPFLFAACSFDDKIDTTFDPCSPLTIVPGSNSEPHELQSIEDAILAWNQVLPTRIEIGPPLGAGGELRILFEPGNTYFRAIYLDKPGKILISRENLAAKDLPLAIAHELGHAFGLWHVPIEERASIMNVGNLDLVPGPEDAFAVSALWDSCNQTP